MQPTKEQVRKWLKDNREAHRPPPTPEEARRELGWDMIQKQQKQKPQK